MRMNPHGTTERLCQDSPSHSSATELWEPRRSSGTTIRPPGASWSSQAGARSLTPTVAITRSYGAPGG